MGDLSDRFLVSHIACDIEVLAIRNEALERDRALLIEAVKKVGEILYDWQFSWKGIPQALEVLKAVFIKCEGGCWPYIEEEASGDPSAIKGRLS